MTDIRRDIKASLETRDSHDQALREGAALRGELGINAQLIALAAIAQVERAQGNEAGYQAIKAEATRLRAAYVAGVPDSDQEIPTGAAILDVVAERIDDATRQHDAVTVKRLGRVRDGIAGGARLRWVLGDLSITSVNSPGVEYVLSCGQCSCPARKPCWHLELLDILITMQDVAAGDADMEADLAEMEADADWQPLIAEIRTPQQLGQRLCAARSRVMQEAA